MLSAARPLAVSLLLTAASLLPAPLSAQTLPPNCTVGGLPHGALSLVCVPAGWNGQLVVFAHGYIRFDEPLGFYQLATPDGTSIPALIQSLGFAFATTSYRQNGLAVLEGAEDVQELVAAFTAARGRPARTILAGVSYGGLVATLLAERSPQYFTSAVSACGPIGNFRHQLNYLGDFRVLFDYFFPNTLPGSPVAIPDTLMENWDKVYVPAITKALASNPARAVELLRVARAPYDPANPATIANTAVNALWYNVFGTNDAVGKLGGNPYGNRLTWYFGSSNDLRLNLLVRRFTASPAALAALRPYETDGDLTIPLVTLHTTGDELVPFAHELLYLPKLDLSGRGAFLPVPVGRYGHCNFTTNELLGAFLVAAIAP